MDFKWLGAVLIMAGCGGFGFSLAAAHRREEGSLQWVLRILDYMTSELHFHSTPLPELSRSASRLCKNPVGQVFSRLSSELEARETPEAALCMERVLAQGQLPPKTRAVLGFLGESLGQFDLDGQLKGLQEARELCRRHLQSLTENRESRLRNYQTLSLCTGAALAILLI